MGYLKLSSFLITMAGLSLGQNAGIQNVDENSASPKSKLTDLMRLKLLAVGDFNSMRKHCLVQNTVFFVLLENLQSLLLP